MDRCGGFTGAESACVCVDAASRSAERRKRWLNTRKLKQRGRSSANYATSSIQTILANRQPVIGCRCSKRTPPTLRRWFDARNASTTSIVAHTSVIGLVWTARMIPSSFANMALEWTVRNEQGAETCVLQLRQLHQRYNKGRNPVSVRNRRSSHWLFAVL